MQMKDFIPMRRFANANDCYTILPRRAIEHGNANYSYKLLPLDIADAHWSTDIVWVHPDTELGEAEQAIVAAMEKLCADSHV